MSLIIPCRRAYETARADPQPPSGIIVKREWLKFYEPGDKKRIPLAPSVAGALILCFILGCLQPITSPTPTQPFALSHLHSAGSIDRRFYRTAAPSSAGGDHGEPAVLMSSATSAA